MKRGIFVDYSNYPGLGITRLRYDGYNLSLKVRHPCYRPQRYNEKLNLQLLNADSIFHYIVLII